MNFAKPELLVWLWLVPAAAALLFFGERRRRRRLALIAGRGGRGAGLALLAPRTYLKWALWLTALTMLVLALAQPRWGFAWTEVKRHGSDLIIAVDVSTSMLAQDIDPSRLERAKHEITDLLGLVQGDRVGLVAFAGDAFVECPLTEDYNAVRMFVNYLAPDLIPMQGTDLGVAIDTSVKALVDGSPDASEGRAIILISDGEDQEGNGERAAQAAKEKGIRLYTIGVGSREGAPIPEPGGGFKKDAQGNLVVTKPDEAALEKLALITGGMFVRSVGGGMDLGRIYHEGIRRQVAEKDYQSTRQKLWYERFQWFLGLALAALVAEFCLRDVRLLAVLALALGGGWCGWSGGAQAADGEGSLPAVEVGTGTAASELERRYNEAVAAYRKGDFAAAQKGFTAAGDAADQGLAERALFNLGNAQAQLGKLEDAEKAYENALGLDPADQEAKDNLAFVKKLQEQQKQQQQENKDKAQNKDEQNKDQQQKDQQQKQNQSGQSGKPSQDQQSQGQQQNKEQQSQGKQGQKDEQKPSPDQQAGGAQDQQKKDDQAKDQAAKDQQAKDQQGKDQQAKDQAAKDQKSKDQQGKDQQAKDQQSGNDPAKDVADKDKQQAGQQGEPKDQQAQPKPDQQAQNPAPSPQSPQPEEKDKEKTAGQTGAQPQNGNGTGKEAAAEQEGAAGQAGEAPPMSPEQADKVLRSVDDNVKKFLYAPNRKNPPRQRDKDW